LSGCFVDGLETSLSGVRRCAHAGLNPVGMFVSFELGVGEEARPEGPRTVIYQMDTVQFGSLPHIVREPRSWRTVTGECLTLRTIMLRDSVSFQPWMAHSHVGTITAGSKDLFEVRLLFHMILFSPPYRTNWVSF